MTEQSDGKEQTANNHKNPAPLGQVKRLVICDEVNIKRLTIEWPEHKKGYDAAHEFISQKYGDVETRTVRLGPKATGDFRVDPEISQWIVDIYI